MTNTVVIFLFLFHAKQQKYILIAYSFVNFTNSISDVLKHYLFYLQVKVCFDLVLFPLSCFCRWHTRVSYVILPEIALSETLTLNYDTSIKFTQSINKEVQQLIVIVANGFVLYYRIDDARSICKSLRLNKTVFNTLIR